MNVKTLLNQLSGYSDDLPVHYVDGASIASTETIRSEQNGEKVRFVVLKPTDGTNENCDQPTAPFGFSSAMAMLESGIEVRRQAWSNPETHLEHHRTTDVNGAPYACIAIAESDAEYSIGTWFPTQAELLAKDWEPYLKDLTGFYRDKKLVGGIASFETVLAAIKHGARVRRKAWRASGQFIEIRSALQTSETGASFVTGVCVGFSVPSDALCHTECSAYLDNLVEWDARSEDLLANDWERVDN